MHSFYLEEICRVEALQSRNLRGLSTVRWCDW